MKCQNFYRKLSPRNNNILNKYFYKRFKICRIFQIAERFSGLALFETAVVDKAEQA